jgi:hypothetical protein
MNLITIQVEVPDTKSLHLDPGDAPPLVVGRATPEPAEQLIGLNPATAAPKTGRRALDDLVAGSGRVALPGAWLPSTPRRAQIPLAIVGTATAESWAQYLGYGQNPLHVYLLLPPSGLSVDVRDGTRVGMREALVRWTAPELGPGLDPARCLRGYRLVVQRPKEAPAVVDDILLPADKTEAIVPAERIAGAERVGIVAEDALLTGPGGTPRRSPVWWLVSGEATVEGSYVKLAGPFDDEGAPQRGVTVTIAYTTPSGQPVTRTAVTDNTGRFAFDRVPAGAEYTLSCPPHRAKGRMPTPARKQVHSLGGIIPAQGVSTAPNPDVVVPPPPPN